MKYYIEKTVSCSFDEAIFKVTEELKKEGFGVLTTINMSEKLKEKLNVDIEKYTILGACNPPAAYKALQAENKIGTMLPCNVIVQKLSDKEVEVAAVDPVASMLAIENSSLEPIAQEIRDKLKKAIDAV